jgi:hypothetical protein
MVEKYRANRVVWVGCRILSRFWKGRGFKPHFKQGPLEDHDGRGILHEFRYRVRACP